MAPRKQVNKLVDGLVASRKARAKKDVVPTGDVSVAQIAETRAAKEAALASILPDIADSAKELSQTDYVKHCTKPSSASQTVAGAVLDQEALALGIVNSNIVAAGAKTNAFKIEIEDCAPDELNTYGRTAKYTFWKDLIAAKIAEPNKYVSIFIPNSVRADGKKITMHSATLYANRTYATDTHSFKCVDNTKLNGCRVFVVAEPYKPNERAKAKFDPAKPTAHLPKLTRKLYTALCEARFTYYDELNNPGESACWYTVDAKLVKVAGMAEEVKEKAIIALHEVGLLKYFSDELMLIKIV